jgi:TusA-related sulfurtransferase
VYIYLNSNIFVIAALDEPEVKKRIKHWIKQMKESREIDDIQALEAYRLSVILVSQLKVLGL